MFICNCNGLRESEVRRLIEARRPSPAEVHKHLGCEVQCGRCLDDIQRLMQESEQSYASAAE